MGALQCEVVPSHNFSIEGFMAAKRDIGDSGLYTIIISNSNTTDTNNMNNDIEFVQELGL